MAGFLLELLMVAYPSSPTAQDFRICSTGDGNCLHCHAEGYQYQFLFTAAPRATDAKPATRDLLHASVCRSRRGRGEWRCGLADPHRYAPGWGIHIVQEVTLLAPKAQSEVVDAAVREIVVIPKRHESCINLVASL